MRYAYSVFCDDIRAEMGGKLSLMGVYQGDLLVPQQPTVLPKLCIVIHAVTTPDRPFRALSIRVWSRDRVFSEQTIPVEALTKIQATLKDSNDPDDPFQRTVIVMNQVISPFVVDAAFTLKATVLADGEELLAGRLRVGFAEMWPPSQNTL